jgi:hypothetical protein
VTERARRCEEPARQGSPPRADASKPRETRRAARRSRAKAGPRKDRRRRRPAARRRCAWLLAGALAACAAPPPAPEPAPSPEEPAPLPLPAPGPCRRIVLIEVYKHERQLAAHCDDGSIREFRIALGRDPVGTKQSTGDHRTPEGLYRVVGPARHSRFHLFLPIDYPSAEDADWARKHGQLSAADHARILRAHAERRLPPHDTSLGGQLGFHGEGERWRGDSAVLDWTYGCIALPDEDIQFIADRAPPGTPVRIWAEAPTPR